VKEVGKVVEINRPFSAALVAFHAVFLVSVLLHKPSYADAVLAYLASYPPLYLGYVALRALKAQKLDSVITPALIIFISSWPFDALKEAEWWRMWYNWLIYLGMSSFVSLAAFHALKSAKDAHVDYGAVADAFALLSALHLVYTLATVTLSLFAKPTLYQLLLWYFAIYPAALAAAVAGGGRLATLAATAIYLAAYLLDAVPLLLLLIAVPVVWRPAAERADSHVVAERR